MRKPVFTDFLDKPGQYTPTTREPIRSGPVQGPQKPTVADKIAPKLTREERAKADSQRAAAKAKKVLKPVRIGKDVYDYEFTGWDTLTPSQKTKAINEARADILANDPTADKKAPNRYDAGEPVKYAGDLVTDINTGLGMIPQVQMMDAYAKTAPGKFTSEKLANFSKAINVQVPESKFYDREGVQMIADLTVNAPSQLVQAGSDVYNENVDNLGKVSGAAQIALAGMGGAQAVKAGKTAFDIARKGGAGVGKALVKGVGSAVAENLGFGADAPTSQADNFSDAIGAPRASGQGADDVSGIDYEDFYGTGNSRRVQGETDPASGTVTPPNPHFTDGYEPTGGVDAPTTSAPGGNVTAAANRIVDEVRLKYNLPDRTKPIPQKMAQWAKEAESVDVDGLIDRLEADPRGVVTAPEQLALDARMSQLQDDLDSLGKQYEDAAKKGTIPDELSDRLDSTRNQIKRAVEVSTDAGTEGARAFVARKALIRADYSVAGVIQKVIKKAGKDARPEDIAWAEAQANQIKELEEELAALPAEKPGADVRRRSIRKAQLDKEEASILGEFKALKSGKAPTPTMRGRQGGAVDIGKLPQYVDVVGRYVGVKIRKGVMMVDDLYAETSKALKGVGLRLSKQDFIDILDDYNTRGSAKALSAAQKADLKARAALKKEIASGSTRGREKAVKVAQEKAAVTAAREAETEARRLATKARKEAFEASQKAKRATKAEDIKKYRAEEKAKRQEASDIMANFRAVGGTAKQAAADVRNAKKLDLNDALGQIALDDAAIARLEAKKESLDLMISEGSYRSPWKRTRTSPLTEERSMLEFQVARTKKQIDAKIDDMAKSRFSKGAEGTLSLLRGLKLGLDMGAVARQGYDVFLQSPTAWAGGIKDGIKSMNAQKAFKLNQELLNSKIGLQAARDGVPLDDIFAHGEEGFGSKVLGMIPGHSALERFHVATQNGYRLRLYKKIAKDIPDLTDFERKSAANFIAAITGRSNKLKTTGNVANAIFTAPKMYVGQAEAMTAWLNLGEYSPLNFKLANRAAKKMVLKRSVARISALVMAKTVAEQFGWEMDLNPDNADFLKLRKGDTVIDIGGGYTSYYRALTSVMNSLASPSRKNKAEDVRNIVLNELGKKLSPGIGLGLNVIAGENFVGEPVFADKEGDRAPADFKSWLDALGTITVNDFYDMNQGTVNMGYEALGLPTTPADERAKFKSMDGVGKAGVGTAAFFGFGAQSYDKKGDKAKNFEDTQLGQILRRYGLEK